MPTFRVTLGSKDTPGIKIRMLKKLNMICGRIHEVFVSYHSLMTAWISTDDVHLCLLAFPDKDHLWDGYGIRKCLVFANLLENEIAPVHSHPSLIFYRDC